MPDIVIFIAKLTLSAESVFSLASRTTSAAFAGVLVLLQPAEAIIGAASNSPAANGIQPRFNPYRKFSKLIAPLSQAVGSKFDSARLANHVAERYKSVSPIV
ncbi:MAG: hypothetical protein AB7J35_21880 [Dehalococcoidia bacterium]